MLDLTPSDRLLERGPYPGQGYFPNDQGFTQPPWISDQQRRWPYISSLWRIRAFTSALPLHRSHGSPLLRWFRYSRVPKGARQLYQHPARGRGTYMDH